MQKILRQASSAARALLTATGASLFLVSLAACPAREEPAHEPTKGYGVQGGQWQSWAGDGSSNRFTPLDQIDASNFSQLEPAWRWASADLELRRRARAENPPRTPFDPRLVAKVFEFQSTPLMVGGRLYGTTAFGQVFALDAETGRELWTHDPKSYDAAKGLMDFWIPKHRGVSYWRDQSDERIFVPTIDGYLIALEAKTGALVPSFGENGRVDLVESLRGKNIRRGKDYFHSSPATIVGDTIVVGGSISDRPITLPGIPGDIRGFDARTGKLKWTFHVVPKADEFGAETWEDGSWKNGGASNAWGIASVDAERGTVFLATSAPTNDHYGGHRPGDNLFSNSLICLDGETGKRLWHQQLVRHDVWDYDISAPPNLIDIEVDGRPIAAVAQITKQGFTFVFDRVSGEPVWPIEQRAVPQSSLPGEKTAATQPIPTRPPPFERIGAVRENLVDFTPAIRAKAEEIFNRYVHGPLYTPPSLQGTLTLPGPPGGANWQGAGFDPETHTLYVPSITHGQVITVQDGKSARAYLRFATKSVETPWAVEAGDPEDKSPGFHPQSIPLFKPPYSRITAIDLNDGTIQWQVANGRGPQDAPALAGLDLPRLGSGANACVLVTSSLLLSVDRAWAWMPRLGEPFLRAYDKETGNLIGEVELPAPARGCPMSYSENDRQFIAIPVGSSEYDPELLALALP